jgi:transcriptional regulator with XRE-family HTH domain
MEIQPNKTGGFGGCLLGLRRSRNLSQKALSILAEMDQSYLAGLEAGRRAPPREKQFSRLISALETSESEEQELRAALAVSKMLNVTSGLQSGKGKVLASLTEHLQDLSLDQIGMVESLASELQRQTNSRELRNLMT